MPKIPHATSQYNTFYNGFVTKDSPHEFLTLAILEGEILRIEDNGHVRVSFVNGSDVCEWGKELPNGKRTTKSA